MKKWFVFLGAVVILAVLAGFTLVRPQSKVYGKDDTNIIVKKGDTFTMMLDENPTTGYTWQYTVVDPNTVVIENDEYVPNDTSGRFVGSGGSRILTFEALKKGSTQIRFVYQRPWESSADDEELVFAIDVK